MAVDRLLPTQEAEDLLALTREIADKELATRVEEHERAETYPEGLFATLGEAGLLGLPYPEEFGGGGQPYEVYLQVLEELAARWAAVAVASSVHGALVLPAAHLRHRRAAGALAARRCSPARLIGGYSLSEPQAGSDAAALRCKAEKVEDGYADQRHQGVDHARRASPTSTRCSRAPARARAACPASSRRARPRASPSASPRRRWACTRSRRPPRTGTARCSRPTG